MENIRKKFVARLKSLKGTPTSIASGVAIGVMVSFTPFIGMHTLLAMVLAWLFRANIVAAALGTIVGNPWTFPFIWTAVYYTGRLILAGEASGAAHIGFEKVFQQSSHALMSFDFSDFFQDVWPVLKPMIVGCVPFCVAAWIISYYIVKRMLEKINNRKRRGLFL